MKMTLDTHAASALIQLIFNGNFLHNQVLVHY